VARATWKSKFGFIMAAAGSAIGLGNIVFFPANAYKYGGGAFYLPYLFALVFLGLPVIIIELGLGRIFSKGFPESLRKMSGFKGEMVGWFAVLNSSVITMYYITILAWVLGMLIRSFGPLWEPVAVEKMGIGAGEVCIGKCHFFSIITSNQAFIFVMIVWLINIIAVIKGTKTIEKIVKVLVPLMWLFMIVIIVRGVTLPGGWEGVLLLFTPELSILASVDVWKGAFSQIFFTLSLGFGIMTTYASYLPKKSDIINDGLSVTFMNCTFEMIAGIAIFALLFVFSISPEASTLSMMFFIMPEGIAQFPSGTVLVFGVLFFVLLFVAGTTSSISLLETVASALIDKFKMSRKVALAIIFLVGASGSMLFALPFVVDKSPMGLTLLDFFDHWAFGYGLLIAGLLETLLVGWVLGADKLRAILNETTKWKLGPWFDVLIKFIIPAFIIVLLSFSLFNEYKSGGIYGHGFKAVNNLNIIVVFAWLLFTVGGSFVLAKLKGGQDA